MKTKRTAAISFFLVFTAMIAAMIILFQGQQKQSQAGPGENFVLLQAGQSPDDIVRLAARIAPSARQAAWQEREFIAFAHFGMNTFTDREWGQGTEDPGLFNPTAFDARQWARILKEAGAKMLILTAKHHDGFCLWPSALTEHGVKKSPWKNGGGDVVGEVSAACREEGLAFGVYLSPWDRHEPSYGDSPRYNEHFRGQLKELLTNYGPIAEVWFDGANGEGPNGKRQTYDWPSYYQVIRELQPQAVIFGMGPDVRWVGTESGYGRETEWSVVPVDIRTSGPVADAASAGSPDGVFVPRDFTGDDLGSREKIRTAKALLWYPAETDVSIRPGWFYHASEDEKVKSPETLVDIYFSSVGRNGVLLLNVPPDKRGLIQENDAAALREMRRILEATFETDFAFGARVRASTQTADGPASAVVDGRPETYWAPAGDAERASLELDLGVPRTFDCAMLQERIALGQRVEAFALQSREGPEWKEFARGTTVGYKRLLRFPAVTADKVRIVIEASRMNPTLAAFGLFKIAEGASSGADQP